MREVVVVCPQERDLHEIRTAGLEQSFGVSYAGPDLDAVDQSFDAVRFVEEYASIPWDGVVGTKDRSALLAALIAERRGLAGPSPSALLNCQHKPTSRLLQRDVVPEAVPTFAYLDGRCDEVPFSPPFFVKPAVGRLSENARRVDDLAELRAMREDGYPDRYAPIAELAGLAPASEHGPASLIEVNGRIASQFAPLVRALHGRSTYEALFQLACGEDPQWRPEHPDGVAVSYCLRTFEDAYVLRVPEPEEGLERS